MAEKNRADLQIVIDANLPDNTTDFITPLLHREVEEDLKDSQFNKPDDTAFDVNYPPTTPLDWGATVPTETGGALDILIKRVSTNASINTAFVATSGSDVFGEYELGNQLKPFLTINAAITAVPTGGVVKVLGGTYVGIVIINKQGITLDFSGCSVIGRVVLQASNLTIIATGAKITNNTASPLFTQNTGTHSNINIIGGLWDGVTGSCISFSANISNVILRSAIFTSIKPTGDSCTWLSNVIAFNCLFETTGGNATCVRVQEETTFNTCNVIAFNGNAIFIFDTKLTINACPLIEGTRAVVGTVTNGFVTRIIAKDSLLIGKTSPCVTLTEVCDEVRFTNCTLASLTSECVSYDGSTIRPATTNNIFDFCEMYSGVGNPTFSELYDVSDLGNAEVMNCIFNVAAGTVYSKVVESNTIYKAGLQLVV